MTNDNLGPYAEFPHPHEVRFIRILPASIERIWAFLTDSEKRATWLAAGPLDPQCGGEVHFRFNHAALSPHEAPREAGDECPNGKEVQGRVIQCDPPNSLGFTWDGSEVDFKLTRLGEETRLVLTHSHLKNIEETIGFAAGWHVHLAYLLARLTRQEPPVFRANQARLADEYATRFSAATVD